MKLNIDGRILNISGTYINQMERAHNGLTTHSAGGYVAPFSKSGLRYLRHIGVVDIASERLTEFGLRIVKAYKNTQKDGQAVADYAKSLLKNPATYERLEFIGNDIKAGRLNYALEFDYKGESRIVNISATWLSKEPNWNSCIIVGYNERVYYTRDRKTIALFLEQREGDFVAFRLQGGEL